VAGAKPLHPRQPRPEVSRPIPCRDDSPISAAATLAAALWLGLQTPENFELASVVLSLAPSTTINMSDSNNSVLPDEIFTVFEFALGAVPAGALRQKVRSLGDFRSVEDAFVTARENAHWVAREMAEEAPTASGTGAPLCVIATEFGYDVKRTHQTLARFWVHARPANSGE
jgi:hypothetical protein